MMIMTMNLLLLFYTCLFTLGLGQVEDSCRDEQEACDEVNVCCQGLDCLDHICGNITYHPGSFAENKILTDKNGRSIRVCDGLTGRPLTYFGERVQFTDRPASSRRRMHLTPDAGATFPSASGGFYYVSNSEMLAALGGGVYTFEFDATGELIDYFPILRGTRVNCGGGKTPWGTWVSCEEVAPIGHCWQTDPSGLYRGQRTHVTATGGNYESFAYDDRYEVPTFYTTEDRDFGPLVRFTPDEEAMECYRDPSPRRKWCTLNSGTHDYLRLIPESEDESSGSFEWIREKYQTNATMYAGSEGIDVHNGMLYFVAAYEKLFALDLDAMTYVVDSTKSGAFDGRPDQVKRIAGGGKGILYFCEEGGAGGGEGVFGRDETNQFFTILETSGFNSETTGLAFSPDKKFMFVALQWQSSIWQFWREDGFLFDGDFIDIHHHSKQDLKVIRT